MIVSKDKLTVTFNRDPIKVFVTQFDGGGSGLFEWIAYNMMAGIYVRPNYGNDRRDGIYLAGWDLII